MPRPTETATLVAPGLPKRASGLIGETPAGLLSSLGPPSLRREEGTAEFWLYASASGCRVDLVLYRDAAGPRVTHVDAKTPARVSEATCLLAIAQARGPMSRAGGASSGA